MTRPVCLVVLDGFGVGSGGPGDATALADTPFFDRLERQYPRANLATSGLAVGLPDGQMGNSEVGHMTLGAGRVLRTDLLRIKDAVDGGELAENATLQRCLDAARAGSGRLHLLGLVSNGGVHSSLDHLDGILAACAEAEISPILHAFTDGRDTPPQSALAWIPPLEARINALGGCIATVSGRYWAMDRDQRWDRVARAYRALVQREGIDASSAAEAVEKAYARQEGDEFIQPSTVSGAPALDRGEVALFFNFRADRARELSNALTRVRPDELGEPILALASAELAQLATMTQYHADFGLPVLFEPVDVLQGVGQLVSDDSQLQLRIAETEKYAHVTYFFNGGRESPYEGEHRVLIPSPRDVATYDQKPEMSAIAVTDALISALAEHDYAFVVVNYANPDMVGHTGEIAPSVRAVETVDACLDRLSQALLALGGTLLITADHGNIEELIDSETGAPHTAHTTNPVPIWWVSRNPEARAMASGGLSDVAPTLCELLGLAQPPEMTGRSLLRSAVGGSS